MLLPHHISSRARPVLRSGEQRPASLVSGGAGRLPPAYREAMEPAGRSRVLTIPARPTKKPGLGEMLMVLVSLVVIAVVTLGEGVVWMAREIVAMLPHLPALFAVLLFAGGAPFLPALIAQALH